MADTSPDVLHCSLDLWIGVAYSQIYPSKLCACQKDTTSVEHKFKLLLLLVLF